MAGAAAGRTRTRMTKPDRLGNLCVLNCDLTEGLFYCAWAPPRSYTAKTQKRHWPAFNYVPEATPRSLPVCQLDPPGCLVLGLEGGNENGPIPLAGGDGIELA
jgi:hypothetical protein